LTNNLRYLGNGPGYDVSMHDSLIGRRIQTFNLYWIGWMALNDLEWCCGRSAEFFTEDSRFRSILCQSSWSKTHIICDKNVAQRLFIKPKTVTVTKNENKVLFSWWQYLCGWPQTSALNRGTCLPSAKMWPIHRDILELVQHSMLVGIITNRKSFMGICDLEWPWTAFRTYMINNSGLVAHSIAMFVCVWLVISINFLLALQQAVP